MALDPRGVRRGLPGAGVGAQIASPLDTQPATIFGCAATLTPTSRLRRCPAAKRCLVAGGQDPSRGPTPRGVSGKAAPRGNPWERLPFGCPFGSYQSSIVPGLYQGLVDPRARRGFRSCCSPPAFRSTASRARTTRTTPRPIPTIRGAHGGFGARLGSSARLGAEAAIGGRRTEDFAAGTHQRR